MGFFINQGGMTSNIDIIGDKVLVDLPLDLYVDENENVYAGKEENNAMLVYTSNNQFYARKVV
jgi:hypothetical protein